MILKPARLTPLTAQYFAQTMLDAGLPAGVLNVVASATASAVSDPLLADSRLRKLSFTGSTPVGKALLKSAAQNVLRTSMELGGNAPFMSSKTQISTKPLKAPWEQKCATWAKPAPPQTDS